VVAVVVDKQEEEEEEEEGRFDFPGILFFYGSSVSPPTTERGLGVPICNCRNKSTTFFGSILK
jgi:hypothetical protein